MATTRDRPKIYVESSTIRYLTARPTEEISARLKREVAEEQGLKNMNKAK